MYFLLFSFSYSIFFFVKYGCWKRQQANGRYSTRTNNKKLRFFDIMIIILSCIGYLFSSFLTIKYQLIKKISIDTYSTPLCRLNNKLNSTNVMLLLFFFLPCFVNNIWNIENIRYDKEKYIWKEQENKKNST